MSAFARHAWSSVGACRLAITALSRVCLAVLPCAVSAAQEAPAATFASIAVLQDGQANPSSAVQQGAYATAAVLQSAPAPFAVVQQGALAALQRPDVLAEAAATRRAQVAAGPVLGAYAAISQAGGSGLQALVVQGAAGAAATVSQRGAYLEAAILQSGGAHSAGIVQTAVGTADRPYHASIAQYGARPQSITLTQTNQSPRVIRVQQQ